jgi:hypothetical protein
VPGSRWTSFVAGRGRRGTLHEEGDPAPTQPAAATRAVDLLRDGSAERPPG